jgi:hypothetical protein
MVPEDTLIDRARLLRMVVDRFDTGSLLDVASARTLFSELRREVDAAGASADDIAFLAEHLVRWVVDSNGRLTDETQQADVRLAEEVFARRPIAVEVVNGQPSVRVGDQETADPIARGANQRAN